ncbi:putative Ig domain-containing protein [Achromobacter xylosoxidans]
MQNRHVNHLIGATLIAGALGAPLLAAASQYFTVVPSPGRQGMPPEPGAELEIVLNAGPLAVGNKGQPYSQDMTPFLRVTGDPAFDISKATWSASAELPSGLSIASTGLISGMPTSTTDGTNFTVTAGYADKSQSQTYTIVINGVTLTASKVVAGGAFSCALTGGGAVYCWGINHSGQLGNGTTATSYRPTQVIGLTTGVSDIAVGNDHACALQSGVLRCWGSNDSGQVTGDGLSTGAPITAPYAVSGLHGSLSSFALGSSFTCATQSGSVYCWGSNSSGQMGYGGIPGINGVTRIDGLNTASMVAAGPSHACAVDMSRAYCWGDNYNGRLGSGSTANWRELQPQLVVGLSSGVTAVAGNATAAHTCAIHNGAAKCWGQNSVNALGNGTTNDALTPVQVSGLTSNVTQISVGGTHTCAITGMTTVCWGDGSNGRLGTGDTTNAPIPIAILNGTPQISAGAYHTCALISGVAHCWGVGSGGRLGSGKDADSLYPLPVER